ncbi:MAG: pimeloyl-ACP methyl ester carboxylesterase [Arenicella sp.]
MENYLTKYTNKYSRFVAIDGALVHYRDEGSGFPLVLLHGAFSSLHTFNAWVEELKPYFRIIRVDLPGFGISHSRIDHSYGISVYTDFLKGFLDTLDIECCHLAGSSLGGWISWEFTSRYPKRVEKLTLLDSAGFLDPSAVPLPFKMARTPFVGRVIKYVIRKNILEKFLRQVYFDQEKVTEELLERYYDLFSREGNPEAFLSLVNGKFKDNTSKLKNIKTPTLIIWGENDEWIPVEYAYKFHKKIPNSKLVIYENVGHIPMEEAPKMTAQDFLQFVGAVKLPKVEKKEEELVA